MDANEVDPLCEREIANGRYLVEKVLGKGGMGLDAHPKSDEFKSTEDLLRELLEGPPRASCKTK